MGKLPNWWFSDEQNPKDLKPIPKKKDKYLELSKKNDNQVIKELSELLINKDEKIDKLESKLHLLESSSEETKFELAQLKKEYNQLYKENSILKDIISKLDTTTFINSSSNPLFLFKEAPKDVVDSVFKTLSKLYHPDLGGSDEKMKSINLARDKFYQENKWT